LNYFTGEKRHFQINLAVAASHCHCCGYCCLFCCIGLGLSGTFTISHFTSSWPLFVYGWFALSSSLNSCRSSVRPSIHLPLKTRPAEVHSAIPSPFLPSSSPLSCDQDPIIDYYCTFRTPAEKRPAASTLLPLAATGTTTTTTTHTTPSFELLACVLFPSVVVHPPPPCLRPFNAACVFRPAGMD
jgi:hypothetical protein